MKKHSVLFLACCLFARVAVGQSQPVATVHDSLNAFVDAHEYASALKVAVQIRDEAKRVNPPISLQVAMAEHGMGYVLLRMRSNHAADSVLTLAADICKKLGKEDGINFATILNSQA
jgi:hypothetical protein